jgi:uncharacterized protein YcbK (DUF882 family)
MGDLTTNFSRREFACRCGCGADHICPQLLAILQQIREAVGHMLEIESGVRCMDHNLRVGGKPNSAHPRGLAVDIVCHSSRLRFQLVSLALQAGVTRIGIGKTFVHLDIDDSLTPRVVWLY